MKKLFIILIWVCATSIASAQEHITFYEIPLDGTIESFTAKLAQKKIKKDPLANISLLKKKNQRIFNGRFAGYKTSDIIVYYDNQTEIVYKGRVVVLNKRDDKLKTIYNRVNTLMQKKYPDAKYIKNDDEKFPSCTYTITNEEGDDIGTIQITTSQQTEKPFKYQLYIDYEDKINSHQHYLQEAKDL